jgi:chaperonin cofactor prefoldin
VRRTLAGIALLLSIGCVRAIHHSLPASARDWVTTLTIAKTAAAEGRFNDADRTLYDFARQYGSAPEAHEVTYWRAVFKLDPANRGGSTRTAIEQLDAYLADSTNATHRTEAALLRRVALELDSLQQPRPVATTTELVEPDHTDDSARAAQREQALQTEIQRLKDQLDKATAELDRIKRRLTTKP